MLKMIYMVGKKYFILSCVLVLWQAGWSPLFAEKSKITIYFNKNTMPVNKYVFGNNFVGYDPVPPKFSEKEYHGYSDYGAGIWDSKWNESVKEVIGFAKDAGITILRFPGGCGVHHYEWREAIGKNREHFQYGIDEFLKTCDEAGAEPVITLSYFTGDEKDKADLIEYLNSPDDGTNPSGGIDWAKERVKNGHKEPYKVKYFEIGNEDWHGDHQKIKFVSPEDYAQRYLKYYAAMRTVDSTIKIGAILFTPEWNQKVLGIIKDKLDFGIIHTYPSPQVGKNQLETMDPKEIYAVTLSKPQTEDEDNFKLTLKLLKEDSGKDVPLAITEYNGGFVQEKPVPYRHCLGTALVNAELLRVFMKPEYNILMANYWQFVNEYWGMVANNFDGTQQTLNNSYYKRPNYYVFEMYHKHFGYFLIGVDVKSDSYKVKGVDIPYLSVNASKSSNGNKLYLMVVNKDLENNQSAAVEIEDFVPAGKGHAWVLNGPSVDATNEKDNNNSSLLVRDCVSGKSTGRSAFYAVLHESNVFEPCINRCNRRWGYQRYCGI